MPVWRRIDWRTVLLLPPQRRFSADELQRAAAEGPGATIQIAFLLNIGLPALGLWLAWGRQQPPLLQAWLGAMLLLLLAGLRLAWRNPSHAVLRWGYWLGPLLAGGVAGLIAVRLGLPRDERLLLVNLPVLLGSVGLWITIVYRHQHIALRLRELEERSRALEMARRLSAAQLAPHFLFNTLASLQHWVHTGDARAPALLDALTGTLRSTLPMFERPSQPLADELQAVRHYLTVMGLRLGDRLRWQIDLPQLLLQAPLPPGLLLTLVENAVEHAVAPRLAGGQLWLGGRQAGPLLQLWVADDGPGPAADAPDGVGLANCRARLALLHGPDARLTLGHRPEGGALALLQFAWVGPA